MKKLIMLIVLIPVAGFAQSKSICGTVDDRVPSFTNEIGRISELKEYAGCTATMISNDCAITAGHCFRYEMVKMEFNTPSSPDNTPQAAKDSDTYEIIASSVVKQDDGIGKDWAVFKLKANSITGLMPGEAQGYYQLYNGDVKTGEMIRITGYGRDTNDTDRNFSQQTHFGKVKIKRSIFSRNSTQLQHSADTMGGNSGSSIILEDSGQIIGVHSHGGCTRSGGRNAGTYIKNHKEFSAAIKACLAK